MVTGASVWVTWRVGWLGLCGPRASQADVELENLKDSQTAEMRRRQQAIKHMHGSAKNVPTIALRSLREFFQCLMNLDHLCNASHIVSSLQ